MKLIPLLFALLIATPMFPQQGTLTVDACRADAKKFFAEMHAPDAANASYFVWAARADEMSRCQDIDPAKPTVESVAPERCVHGDRKRSKSSDDSGTEQLHSPPQFAKIIHRR